MESPRNVGGRGLWLNSRDQRSIATILAVLVALHLSWLCLVQDPLVSIDQASSAEELRFALDLNTADWPELLLLPEIGETLAKRIVDSREEKGRFQSVAQLRRVRGIGPAKLARIRPYLRPIRTTFKRGEESP